MSTTSTAEVINNAMQDPVPFMGETPDLSVRLLKGYEGKKEAVVREMTGADEEFLASLEVRTSMPYPEYVSSLLKRTVVSIGDLQVSKADHVIDELIIGDRDILFLAVVKATYGATRTYALTCPHCKEETSLSVNVDEDFPIQGTEVDADNPIEVTLRNGEVCKFNHPTGRVSKEINKKAKTPAEQNTQMLSLCLQNDKIVNKMEWARNLSVGDRNKIIDALFAVKIGPKVGEVNDPCPSCGEQIVLPLDWVSLLFG